MKDKRRIAFYFALPVVFFLVVVSIFTTLSVLSRKYTVESNYNAMDVSAQEDALTVSVTFDLTMSTLAVVTENDIFGDMDANRFAIVDTLDAIEKQHALLHALFIRADGVTVNANGDVYTPQSTALLSLADATERTVIDTSGSDAGLGNSYLVVMPVYSESGDARHGVLVAALGKSSIADVFSERETESHATTLCWFDSNGNVLVHSQNPGFVGSNLTANFFDIIDTAKNTKDSVNSQELRELLATGASVHFSLTEESSGESWYVSVNRLDIDALGTGALYAVSAVTYTAIDSELGAIHSVIGVLLPISILAVLGLAVLMVLLARRNNMLVAMSDSVNGGTHSCRYDAQGNLIFENVSDGMLELLGYTREEYDLSIGKDFLQVVHRDNRSSLAQVFTTILREPSHGKIQFRVKKKDESTVWLLENATSYVDVDRKLRLVGLIHPVDSTNVLSDSLGAVINDVPGAIATYNLYDDDRLEVSFFNRTLSAFFEISEQQYREMAVTNPLLFVKPDDLEMVKARILETRVRSETIRNVEHRVITPKGTEKWLSLSIKVINRYPDHIVLCAVLIDITMRKQAQEQIAHQTFYQRLVDTYVDAGTLVLPTDYLKKPLHVSDSFCRLAKYTREELIAKREEGYRSLFHPDDYDRVVSIARASAQNHEEHFDMEFRFICGDGSVVWLWEKGTLITDEDGDSAYIFVFVNNNRQHKLLEQLEAAVREGARLRTLADAALIGERLAAWNYDPVAHTIDQTQYSSKIFGIDESLIENVPQVFLDRGFVYPDDKEIFLDLYRSVDKGENASATVRWKTAKSDDWFWVRISYTPVFDDDGKLYLAVGTSADVTADMEIRQIYEDELQFINSAGTDFISAHRINLTKSVVEQSRSNLVGRDYNMINGDDGASYGKFLENCKSFVRDPDDAARCIVEFGEQTLLHEFAMGTTEKDVVYRQLMPNGDHRWMNTHVKLMKDPDSGDIIGFFNTTDIHNEHTTTELVESVIDLEYLYVALVDINRNSLTIYSGTGGESRIEPLRDKSYDDVAKFIVETYCSPETKEAETKAISRATIAEELERENDYVHYVDFTRHSGEHIHVMIRCNYLEKSIGRVVLTMKDVTHVFETERTRNDELQQAIDKVEEAMHVKSEFLSKVSHELRTPMNAIIGLARLGIETSLKNNWSVNEYERIVESSKYLLTLINDILDVGSIDSGKLEIEREWHTPKSVMAPVIEMIEPIMRAKDINFTYSFNGREQLTEDIECYCDKSRWQQVLVNVLSNACKFTESGGNVSWTIDVSQNEDGTSTETATITDTGCGMTKEFLKHLYEPFMQERKLWSSDVPGTGLGMYFVKRICDQSGFEIETTSEPGKGTTVTITSHHKHRDVVQEEKKQTLNLAGKRVLLVEDNEMNTVVATWMLETVSATVETAENGKIGVEMFTASAPGYYSVILMDIRMPIMNGIESTLAIRNSSHPDAKTIPIIAVTANTLDSDIEACTAAGMNAHVPKPIEPDVLYSAIREQLGL